MTLDPNIVHQRKEAAPKLRAIIERAEACSAALSQLRMDSNNLSDNPQSLQAAIDRNIGRLKTLSDRVAIRHERFKKGLVTVAVGGIEKSGKTTLLKTLTGIDNLPTANERCTAVCCEIIYDSRNTFDLEFHDEQSFVLSVLNPLVEAYNQSLSVSTEGENHKLPKFQSLSQFFSHILPASSRFYAGTKSAILIKDLSFIQEQRAELLRYIGCGPRRDICLEELTEWVAHNDNLASKAKVSAVSRCTIYTAFEGGSDNLRWIDTPGVDDPSPLAREKTLKSVGHDADLLVVGTMPRDQPTPTESFVNFWTSIHKLPDEVNLMDRLLILLNWKREADPQQYNIIKHQRFLQDHHGIPSHLFCGPIQAVVAEEVQGFMGRVNETSQSFSS